MTENMRDARSLVRQMQAMVGKLNLPVRVVVSSRLSALAATGSGVIYVGSGNELTEAAAKQPCCTKFTGTSFHASTPLD